MSSNEIPTIYGPIHYYLPKEKSLEALRNLGFNGVDSEFPGEHNATVIVSGQKTLPRDGLEVFQASVQGETEASIHTTLMILSRLGHAGIIETKKEWKYIDLFEAWQGPFSLKGLYRWKGVGPLQDVMIMNETTQMWLSFHHVVKLYEFVKPFVSANSDAIAPPVPEPAAVGDVNPPASSESLSQETAPDDGVRVPVPAPAVPTPVTPISKGSSETDQLLPVPVPEPLVPVPASAPIDRAQSIIPKPVQISTEPWTLSPPQMPIRDSRTGPLSYERGGQKSPVRSRDRGNYHRSNPRGTNHQGARPYQSFYRPQRGTPFRGGRAPMRSYRGRNGAQNSNSRPTSFRPAAPVMELLNRLDRYPSTIGDPAVWNSQLQQISDMIEQSLPKAMIYIVQTIYGLLWTDMLSISPPWNDQQILQVMYNHWNAVLTQIFPKTAFHILHEIKIVYKGIRQGEVGAAMCLKLASFVKEFYRLLVMGPVKESPPPENICLPADDPELITFEVAVQAMRKAQTQSGQILNSCMQIITSLIGDVSRPVRTPINTVRMPQTVTRAPVSPARLPIPVQQMNTGRGYSARPAVNPMDRPMLPQSLNEGTVTLPRPAVETAKPKVDYKWAREVTEGCQATSTTGYELLKFVKELFERIIPYCMTHIGIIQTDNGKLLALQAIVDKTEAVLESLKAAQRGVTSKNLTERLSTAVLTAMKEFISIVCTEAYKYCRRLQMPDETFISEFEDQLSANEGEKLNRIVIFFEVNYIRLKQLLD
eukprot:g1063.t1